MIKGNDIIGIIMYNAIWCRNTVAFNIAIKWTYMRKRAVA